MTTKRKLTSIGLVLVICYASIGWACDQNKARELAKGVDTVAEAELRIANFVKESKETGILTQTDVDMIKPYLIAVNDANREAIALVKKVGTEPTADQQTEILTHISMISATLNRLNQQGLLRIKDSQKRAVFTGLVLAAQGAVSSVVVILVKKG